MQLGDVWMIHLFQKRNLAYCRRGDSFVIVVHMNALESDLGTGTDVSRFIYDAVGSLADALQAVVVGDGHLKYW